MQNFDLNKQKATLKHESTTASSSIPLELNVLFATRFPIKPCTETVRRTPIVFLATPRPATPTDHRHHLKELKPCYLLLKSITMLQSRSFLLYPAPHYLVKLCLGHLQHHPQHFQLSQHPQRNPRHLHHFLQHRHYQSHLQHHNHITITS